MEGYLKRKWEWVDSHPRLAAWLGWFKGLLTGLILWWVLS